MSERTEPTTRLPTPPPAQHRHAVASGGGRTELPAGPSTPGCSTTPTTSAVRPGRLGRRDDGRLRRCHEVCGYALAASSSMYAARSSYLGQAAPHTEAHSAGSAGSASTPSPGGGRRCSNSRPTFRRRCSPTYSGSPSRPRRTGRTPPAGTGPATPRPPPGPGRRTHLALSRRADDRVRVEHSTHSNNAVHQFQRRGPAARRPALPRPHLAGDVDALRADPRRHRESRVPALSKNHN